jgi:tetratricopeptide (TPR) repeat protein
MLARQYATDHALAYSEPLLLDAGADRSRDDNPMSPMDRLLGAVLQWLEALGAQNLPDRSDRHAWSKVKEVVRGLQSHEQPFLWIVDDLPPGLSAKDIDNLACPAPGRTLITTRTGYYEPILTRQRTLRLGPLSVEDAIYLLAGGDRGIMTEHADALALIAEEVGFHSLALGVLTPRLESQSPRALLERLRRSVADEYQELQAAAEQVGELPGGHAASIVATLQDSIASVQRPEAQQILTLSSMWPSGTGMEIEMLAAVIPGREHDGVAELVQANLATMLGYEALRVHAMLAKVVAWLALDDPDPRANDWLRVGAAAWLQDRVDDETEDVWDRAEAGALTWHLLEPIADRLDPPDAMRASRALMAMARLPMRYKPTGLDAESLLAHLREALDWACTASELVPGTDRESQLSRGRALAMQGLLTLDIAYRDDANALDATLEAIELLKASWAMRAPLLTGPADLDERTKAQFNFGRAYLKLGQVRAALGDFDEMTLALDTAFDWYGSTALSRLQLQVGTDAKARSTKLRDLASCYRGQAVVCSQRALLVPDWSVAQRHKTLDEAQKYLRRARECTLDAYGYASTKEVLADMAKDMQVAANLAMLNDVLDLMEAGASIAECRTRLAEELHYRPVEVLTGNRRVEPLAAPVALARLDAHKPGAGDEHLRKFVTSELDHFERTLAYREGLS